MTNILKIKFSKDFLRAWHTYNHKACVNRNSSQMASSNAYNIIESYLTPEEKGKLGTALSHALFVGEGRGEFDRVCLEISNRLGIPKKTKKRKSNQMGIPKTHSNRQ